MSKATNHRPQDGHKKIREKKSDQNILVGGIPTPLKNMKVSWDDYPQYMEKYKMFQTTNQHT